MDRELEKQLEELQKNFAGLAKTLGSSSKTILKNSRDQKTFGNLQKVVNKSLGDYQKKNKRFVFGMESFGEAIAAAKQDVKGFSFNLKGIPSPVGLVVKGLKVLKDATIGVGVAMIKTALALSDSTKSFKGLEDIVDVGIGELSVVGKVAKELSKDIDANVGVFRTLAQTGASFGSSIVMLRKAQEDAAMPLDKFTDLIAQNSGTLAKLFGSVDQGVPQITGFMRGLRDMTMNEFAKFGLTLDETSGFLGTFLELERARGNTTKMTQDQLLAGTRAYTKDLVLLSKLTGESVDELNNQNMAMAADGVFQSQLQGMAAKDAKTLSLGISALPPGLKQLAKEVIGLGQPISDTSKDLTALSSGAFNDAIKQFQNTGDLVAFQNSIKTISGDVMQNSKAFGQATLAGGGFGEALNAVAASIGTAVDEADITGELQAAGDNIGKVLNATTGEVDLLQESLQTARFKALNPFIFSGEKSGKGLDKLSSLLEEFRLEGVDKIEKKVEQIGQFLMGEEISDTNTGKSKDSAFSLSNFFRTNASDDGLDYLPQFKEGSGGFRNFGTGTVAKLHGVEAVVPKNDIGQLAKEMFALGAPVSDAAKTEMSTITNNNTTMEMTTFTNKLDDLIKTNVNMENHLNKLVAVNMMTEKNTKTTNNELANMGGSLV
jgi:hypothetical protein